MLLSGNITPVGTGYYDAQTGVQVGVQTINDGYGWQYTFEQAGAGAPAWGGGGYFDSPYAGDPWLTDWGLIGDPSSGGGGGCCCGTPRCAGSCSTPGAGGPGAGPGGGGGGPVAVPGPDAWGGAAITLERALRDLWWLLNWGGFPWWLLLLLLLLLKRKDRR